MKRLSATQNNSVEKLAAMLKSRLDESPLFVNKIQEDPESKSALCEIIFSTRKALVWVRQNGSISSDSGARILLSGGARPKNNPDLSGFLKNI
jgi:hypothetical protein